MNKTYLVILIVLALIIAGGIFWYAQQIPKIEEVVAPAVIEKPLPEDITEASQTVITEILSEIDELIPLPEEDASFIEENASVYEEELLSEL